MGRKNLPNLYSHSTVKSPCLNCPNRTADCHYQTDGNWNCAAYGLYKEAISVDSQKKRQAQLCSVRTYNEERVRKNERKKYTARRGRKTHADKQY